MKDGCSAILDLLGSAGNWPLQTFDLSDLTFTYRKAEIQFLRNEAASIEAIYQIRPIAGLKSTVFIVDQGDRELNRFAIRRIAIHFSTRMPRLAARPYFSLEAMIFIVASAGPSVAIVHFRGESALTAAMAVIGPEPIQRSFPVIQQVAWERMLVTSWSLEPELYKRLPRTRSSLHCTTQYLEAKSPELLSLFHEGLLASSVSQGEEDRLFDHAQRGASCAIDQIVRQHLTMVFDVAYRIEKRYEACNVPFVDIFSGGIEGLMVALKKYEYERSHRFRTFAWQWVANKADRAFVEALWPIAVPYYVWERVCKACHVYSREKLDLVGSDSECLSDVNYDDDDQYDRALKLITSDAVQIVDIAELGELADPGAEHCFHKVLEDSAAPWILDALTVRQQVVLMLRFGLHPDAQGKELTLEAIANLLQVTRERVRQIEIQAIKKLRKLALNAGTGIDP